MTAYTVWNNSIPAGTTSAAVSARTSGLQFSVSSDCTLTGIAFYVPAGETNLAGSNYVALLYTTTTGYSGTQVVSQAGSGTFTAGAWNWITVSYSLVTGTTYVAAVSSPDDLQYEHTYWSSGAGVGGVTSGPITVPDESSALDHVQQGEANAAATFPGTNSASSWYGVDIQVTTGGTPHTATAALTVTPSFSAVRARGTYRTAALTVTPSFSAARQRGKYRTGSLTVTPSFSAARARGHYRTGALEVIPVFAAVRIRGRYRSAALTVTPSFSAIPSGGAFAPPVFIYPAYWTAAWVQADTRVTVSPAGAQTATVTSAVLGESAATLYPPGPAVIYPSP